MRGRASRFGTVRRQRPEKTIRRATGALCAAALCVAASLALVPAAVAQGTITEPAQPRGGPGGSEAANAGIRITSGGEGADAWYAFEPLKPRPKRAPLTVITHGYYEFSGYSQMEALIRHTVAGGSIAIYTRWQTDVASPCPGPYDIEPCMRSEVNGIRGAIHMLQTEPGHVRPQLAKTSYFGFSFGGIITANLANRWRELGVPKPRAVFLDDPHDGGLTGTDEPALDDSLAGIPRSTLVQCHSGAAGVMAVPPGAPNHGGGGESCNAVLPKLTSVPAKNKDLVQTETDGHGQPVLSSTHGVCAAGGGFGPPNAYDWNFCWKVWDALRSCALEGRWCNYALGDTRRHRSLGAWSDGTPVAPLTIRDSPIPMGAAAGTGAG
jgi:pimeloyl-ACP methyl ester carboxylesterase